MKPSALVALISLLPSLVLAQAAPANSHQATGVKVGEITQDSAILWVRHTAADTRNNAGLIPGSPEWQKAYDAGLPKDRPADPEPMAGGKRKKKAGPVIWPTWISPARLEGNCPGAPGRVRLRYATSESLSDAAWLDWATAAPETDCSHQFHLSGLKPDTIYFYETQTAPPDGAPHPATLRGKFRTAPAPTTDARVRFVVITGQHYEKTDLPPTPDAAAGDYLSYASMRALAPDFIVPTGDTVYYDSGHRGAFAFNRDMARHHWHRVYSLPNVIRFHLASAGYWEKDDHDTVDNDCWPGAKLGSLTWPEGLATFREQVPMGEKTYRTIRWGKALQIWLVEGRDFRSPNTDPDGPEKTIWGTGQKAWLKRTLLESDASWRVLISPTPLVGPDRGPASKADNHANLAFQHEGDEMRHWFRDNVASNFFIVCGDRHWQYHSIHPGTGLHEFSCGPLTDKHASGSPGHNPEYHRYHNLIGGFLSVTVEPQPEGGSLIAFRHHDTAGKVLHEATWPRRAGS